MKPFTTPSEAMRLAMQSGMMLAEANMVIAMRLMGMGGMWRVTPAETARMVKEKTDAAVASGQAMGRAMAAGHGPAKVALAGLKPVRAKTRANASRLAKRGPGKPT
jgi:uncharacterized membrane protein